MNSDLFFPHFPQIPSASTQSPLNHKSLGIKPPNAGSVFRGHPTMMLRKPAVPKRASLAKSYRIRDIEALGRPRCPTLRERWFANINAWPIVHRNDLQARHRCFELLVEGFVSSVHPCVTDCVRQCPTYIGTEG
jgi:hypothetical protein